MVWGMKRPSILHRLKRLPKSIIARRIRCKIVTSTSYSLSVSLSLSIFLFLYLSLSLSLSLFLSLSNSLSLSLSLSFSFFLTLSHAHAKSTCYISIEETSNPVQLNPYLFKPGRDSACDFRTLTLLHTTQTTLLFYRLIEMPLGVWGRD